MRTETRIHEFYKFEELDDKAKEKARDWFRSGNDFDFEWDTIKEDAKNIGLKLTAWEYGRYAEGKFIKSPVAVANAILKEHGDMCETHKTAAAFIAEWNKIATDCPVDYADDETDWKDSRECEEAQEAAEEEFLKSLLEDYRINADNQFDFIQSDESVDENITCNEYEFTKEGKRA